MTTTLNVSEEIHDDIFDKWIELRKKGTKVGIGKIAEEAIKKGLPLVDFEVKE